MRSQLPGLALGSFRRAEGVGGELLRVVVRVGLASAPRRAAMDLDHHSLMIDVTSLASACSSTLVPGGQRLAGTE